MGALHGDLGVTRGQGWSPATHQFKEEVWKTKNIKYKPPP
jgi:hypothetical protein